MLIQNLKRFFEVKADDRRTPGDGCGPEPDRDAAPVSAARTITAVAGEMAAPAAKRNAPETGITMSR